MARKYRGIDILKFYSTSNTTLWNKFLTDCYKNRDVNKLSQMRYSLQVGMTDLANKKMNTDKINVTFLRWQRSIEVTVKRILKVKYPVKNDNPLQADKDGLNAKRKRDAELERFFKKSGF